MSLLFKKSRGFGIHSPFAYHFVTGVIGESYRYYLYDTLEAKASQSRLRHRELARAKLLHRVGVQFHQSRFVIEGSLTELEREGLEGASKALRIVDRGEAGERHVVIVTDLSRLPALKEAMSSGMSFTSSDIAIIVHDPKLPLTHIKFKF